MKRSGMYVEHEDGRTGSVYNDQQHKLLPAGKVLVCWGHKEETPNAVRIIVDSESKPTLVSISKLKIVGYFD